MTSSSRRFSSRKIHENGFKRGRGLDSQGIKFVEKNRLVDDFLNYFSHAQSNAE